MTIENIKMLNLKNISPVDTVLEWSCEKIILTSGGMRLEEYSISGNRRLPIANNKIDKIIITNIINDSSESDFIIKESSRLLKKNGKLFLTFCSSCNKSKGILGSVKAKIFKKDKNVHEFDIECLANQVENNSMLIDKNVIIEEGMIYCEIIKLENDQIVNGGEPWNAYMHGGQ